MSVNGSAQFTLAKQTTFRMVRPGKYSLITRFGKVYVTEGGEVDERGWIAIDRINDRLSEHDIKLGAHARELELLHSSLDKITGSIVKVETVVTEIRDTQNRQIGGLNAGRFAIGLLLAILGAIAAWVGLFS